MHNFRILLVTCLALLTLTAWRMSVQTTILLGKVTDENGEALVGATVKVLKGADLIRGAVTDINGEYRVSLDPGVYNVEFSYTGFSKSIVENVTVKADAINTLDQQMATPRALEAVVITAYKVPLVQQDQTSGGQTLTAGQLRRQGVNKNSNRAYGNARSAPYVKNAEKSQKRSDQVGKPGSRKQDKHPKSDTTHDYAAENYAHFQENAFLSAKDNPVSTFSIDVDVASYANLRRFLNKEQLPPPDAVRIEEMLNYFDYQYAPPADQHPFAVHTELSPCPWAPDHQLLLVGLQGRGIETGQLPPSNFVFLIDVSGSMDSPDKLPLVQESLRLLTDQMRPQDRVALVVYAGAAGLVLPSTPGSDKAAIKTAIDRLSAGGSTAGAAGIQLAYQVARSNYQERGNNRVILCTDGDFNVGVSSESELVRLIEKERESGVFLTVLGFGTGNYQDAKMQQLADKGNGNHAYIDQAAEAKKVLVTEFGGTLFAIAKDVKLQLEFNPVRVAGYRLIGYENRVLAREDFDDDAKDAGELGSGHRVTALYEVVPAGKPLPLAQGSGPLKYQTVQTNSVAASSGELCTLKLRYKQPKPKASSTLMETVVMDVASKKMSENMQLAASVAGFGMLLRDSRYKGSATFSQMLALAKEAAKHDPYGYRTELCGLIEKAESLKGSNAAAK